MKLVFTDGSQSRTGLSDENEELRWYAMRTVESYSIDAPFARHPGGASLLHCEGDRCNTGARIMGRDSRGRTSDRCDDAPQAMLFGGE